MISVIVGAFVLCWAPFAVMFIMFPTNPITLDQDIIDLITWIGEMIYILYYDWKDLHEFYTAVTLLCKRQQLVKLMYNRSFNIISGYINSSLNPIIYAIMNPGIKKVVCEKFGVFSKCAKGSTGRDDSVSKW